MKQIQKAKTTIQRLALEQGLSMKITGVHLDQQIGAFFSDTIRNSAKKVSQASKLSRSIVMQDTQGTTDQKDRLNAQIQ